MAFGWCCLSWPGTARLRDSEPGRCWRFRAPRAFVSILNGEQVVELDFVSMHVALAYAVCGG
jgi:hypothetical protein